MRRLFKIKPYFNLFTLQIGEYVFVIYLHEKNYIYKILKFSKHCKLNIILSYINEKKAEDIFMFFFLNIFSHNFVIKKHLHSFLMKLVPKYLKVFCLFC